MIALLFNYTVYYMTIIDVEPDTELLSMVLTVLFCHWFTHLNVSFSVWYGTNYAKKVLSIYTKRGSGHNWEIDIAPPLDKVVCPTCPNTEGPIDEDEPAIVEDHHSEDLIHIPDDEPEDNEPEDIDETEYENESAA